MTPELSGPGYAKWPEVVELIRESFADMPAPFEHPARAISVTAEQLADAAKRGAA